MQWRGGEPSGNRGGSGPFGSAAPGPITPLAPEQDRSVPSRWAEGGSGRRSPLETPSNVKECESVEQVVGALASDERNDHGGQAGQLRDRRTADPEHHRRRGERHSVPAGGTARRADHPNGIPRSGRRWRAGPPVRIVPQGTRPRRSRIVARERSCLPLLLRPQSALSPSVWIGLIPRLESHPADRDRARDLSFDSVAQGRPARVARRTEHVLQIAENYLLLLMASACSSAEAPSSEAGPPSDAGGGTPTGQTPVSEAGSPSPDAAAGGPPTGQAPVSDAGRDAGNGGASNDDRMYPFEVGRSWTYRVDSDYGSCPTGQTSFNISPNPRSTGKIALPCRRPVATSEERTLLITYAPDGDVLDVKLDWNAFRVWMRYLDTPVQDGHTWETTNGSATFDMKYRRLGSVRVAAGKIEDCWEVAQQASITQRWVYCRGVRCGRGALGARHRVLGVLAREHLS